MDCFLYTAWMTWEFIGELLVIHQLSLGLSLGLNTPLPHPDQRVHRGAAGDPPAVVGLVVGLEHPSPAP